ncbi:MAG TPA: peptidase M15 [Gallionellaceae bacterium]|nr:peptidase M15 [Gallionellaceae bacterium]
MKLRLTDHFSLDEMLRSDTALRLGINNSNPPFEVVRNLGLLADTMERVRAQLGVPIYISSGYRCPALNAAIGGAKTSAHMHGLAVDFIAPDFGSPLEVAQKIAGSLIDYDQLIHEGAWVHLAISRHNNRCEELTAHFDKGRVSYTAGLSLSRNTVA